MNRQFGIFMLSVAGAVASRPAPMRQHAFIIVNDRQEKYLKIAVHGQTVQP
jgi:hypothetical protein